MQRTVRRYSTPRLARRVLGSRGVQRTARSYSRASSRGRQVLRSRSVQRVGRQGQRQLARQVLLQSLINRQPTGVALSRYFNPRASGTVNAGVLSALPGRSSKTLPQDQPSSRGPTGGVGPPRGSVATPVRQALSAGEHAINAVSPHRPDDFMRLVDRFAREHYGPEALLHPNETTRLLADPKRLGRGIKTYVHNRQLEQATYGRVHFQDIPYVDPKKLAIDTPRALIEHPSAIGKTLKDLASLPVSAPAGVVGALSDPVKAYHYLAADTNRRYRGSAGAYRRRIGREGAAPEITDALGVGAPEASILGRGLGQVARSGSLGGRVRRFASESRPALRTSGNVTHAQDLSANLFRASLQRYEDRLRARRTAKLNRKHSAAKPGLQPRGGRGRSGRPREVVPLFQKRAQRVEVSRVQSRNYQAFRRQHHQEVTRGAQHAISRLNRHQQRAVFHVLQGLVRLDDPRVAVEQLLARRSRIDAAWRKSGVEKPPPELKTIDYLVRHADKVFIPELAKFHAGELARAGRVGHVGVSSHVAEARRYRPQARELGVDYTYHKLRDQIQADAKRALARTGDKNEAARIKQRRDQRLDELAQRRPELDRQFVTTVKAKAAEQGLPEPVYVQHFKHQSAAQAEQDLPGPQAAGRAAHALGGSRAAPGVKQSEMRLFDTGRADTSSQAYVQSVARTVKRGHNWRAVGEQVDTHAFPNPTPSELEAAFGHKHVNPGQLTADEWKTILTHRGVDHSEYALWSPGKFQREVTHAAAQDAQHGSGKAGAHDAVEMQAAFESSAGPAEQAVDEFGRDQGVRMIPREVYNELHATIKAASATGRLVDKLQGLQSSVLLGTNPSWLQIQVGANAFLAGFGTRGNVADFIKAPLFYRTLDKPTKEALNDLMGTGVGEAHSRNAKLGAAANNRIVDGYRAMRAALGFKAAAAKNAVPLVRDLPTLNPIHLMFAVDNAQNRYFKRVVLYNQVKRQAFRDMAAEGGVAFRLQAQIAHLLSLGPKARIEAIMRDPALLERHAQAVDNVLGNYVRYTARERATFKRYVLFYGFMRYSLRTLLYTLPVKHPVVASVAAKLAQLHNQEVRDLIGKDAPPWVLASIYMGTKVGKGGRMVFTDPAVQAGRKPPRTIGLSRLNPVTNPLVDLVTEGPKALGSFISPVLQIALNQMYGRNLFTHRDYEPGTSGARRVLNELGQLAFPYRAAVRATQPGPSKYYKSDTLLFSPRPKHYKTPAKRAETRRAIRADKQAGSLLSQLLPFVPKQDFTAQGAKQRQHQSSKKKHGGGGGGNLFGPGGGGGGGGGGGSGSFMAPHRQLHGRGVRLAGLEAIFPGVAGKALASAAVTGQVHHGDALPKIAADVLAGSVANAGTYHAGRFPTRPRDPGIVAPHNKILEGEGGPRSSTSAMLGRILGTSKQITGKVATAFPANPFHPSERYLPQGKIKPAGWLGYQNVPKQPIGKNLTKSRLFAHPQRPGAGKLGRIQIAKHQTGQPPPMLGKAVLIKSGQFVLPANLPSRGPTSPPGKPGAVLSRFSRHGVKDQSGRVVIPAKHARGIIHNFSQLGYGHGQIVDYLTHGKKRKQLGVPAQVTRAMQVLKHVSAGAVVPQNKSYYSPADISKMAQSHGAPKWLADALGATSVHESRGIPRGPGSVSNSPGGGSRGLLQINPAAWGGVNHLNLRGNYGKLFNPDYNVRAALYVVSQQGSSAWSASGTWRGPAVPPGRFNFPVPEKQKRAARLTPRQQQAEKVARRAARAWASAGQAPVPHKVPAQIRAMLGHIPTQRAKGGPSLKELPKPVQRFLKQYLPQPAAAPSVSTSTTSSVSTSAPSAAAGQPSSGGGGAGGGGAGGSAGVAAAQQLLSGGGGPLAQDQQVATILSELITRNHGADSPLLSSGLLSLLYPDAALPSSFTSAGAGAGGAGGGVPLLSVLLDELNRPGRRRALAGV